MPVKLLIFDLDGTLVDSSGDIAEAINYAFSPYGVSEVSVAETVTLIGEGLTRLIEKVIERKAPGLDPGTLVARFLEHYSAHVADLTRPYPGVEKVLKALSRYKKAIVSNKTEALSMKVLEALDLLKYFDCVLGGDTLTEKKPSPAPILDVLSRLDMRPEEALIIGDSIYDIEAGRAAGVKTVAALCGYGDPGFWKEADYRVESIEGLIGILDLKAR
ncbi:MAG: HAD-IA family hydrolase [Syntrophorhabdales bacterium]|jgi:phosphoglycolate phosphatase